MLPTLRQDLQLYRAPADRSGAPSFTLLDPVANRFFQISWQAFEVLSRWHLGDAKRIAAAVRAETVLQIDAEAVEQTLHYLSAHNLTSSTPKDAVQRALRHQAASSQIAFSWLLHNYLFIRQPLVRPDRLLGRLLPWTRWIYSRGFLAATLMALLLGLFLLGRQWDSFTESVVSPFGLDTIALWGIALGLVKICHEFGHGLTAKRLGCRVPTMGVALIVLWPVLYTDLNEAWKLERNGSRLAIAVAGIATELGIAAWATLLWSFMSPGAWRDTVALIAAISWLSSLLINLSPFMRFDGYFVLVDWLGMPNLHARSFALARWYLRRVLFGFRDEAPEDFSPSMQAFLVAFAITCWIYRLLLFIGIAVLVYHFTFKALGILLFTVEMAWFVIRPIYSEARVWGERWREIVRGGRILITGPLLLLSLLALFKLPVPTTAPAVLKATEVARINTPFPSRLKKMLVQEGQWVEAGDPVAILESPDLQAALERAELREQDALAALSAALSGADTRDRQQSLREAWRAAVVDRQGAQRELERLELHAPVRGKVVDIEKTLRPGDWLPVRHQIASITSADTPQVTAYVAEEDVVRLSTGSKAIFLPVAEPMKSVECHLLEAGRSRAAVLADPVLAGQYRTRLRLREKEGQYLPQNAVYIVRCFPTQPLPPIRSETVGMLVITDADASASARLFRTVAATVVREVGF